jgi:hypothetical protein
VREISTPFVHAFRTELGSSLPWLAAVEYSSSLNTNDEKTRKKKKKRAEGRKEGRKLYSSQ